jgi:hypothetical protein
MVNFARLKKQLIFSLLLSLGLSSAIAVRINAQTPADAPPELKNIIGQIDTAANSKNLEQLMGFYSSEFKSSDGLDSSKLSEAIKKLWENYPDLKYSTQLLSWERKGDELMAQTSTTLVGTGNKDGRVNQLNSEIVSRQYFRGDKLVRQEIVTEKTDVTSGDNPPKVKVILPGQVRVGQQFNFDVIVEEPLLNNVLLGEAMEEEVGGDRYLNPGVVDLDFLSAGGLFKLGTAPPTPGDRWLSAIIVRSDGLTMITRRLRVTE